MHLGNLRTALLAWLQIRALGGVVVLRIEDVDAGRCRPQFESLLLDDMRWLGLDWDEGPDIGGPYGPYRQSERDSVYAAAIKELDTFACTCTRAEVREAASAPHGVEPVYPGTCRASPSDPSRPAALRWNTPPGNVDVRDQLGASLAQDMRTDVGDFVLRRTDGAWAYQLAVVVDDAAMQVTHVLRGADLWTSTPRQIHLQRALGFPELTYCHVPLLLGPDGRKLSKRHGAPDVAGLRDAGVDPRRVVGWLARTAGLEGDELCTPADLVAVFDESTCDTTPQAVHPDEVRRALAL